MILKTRRNDTKEVVISYMAEFDVIYKDKLQFRL